MLLDSAAASTVIVRPWIDPVVDPIGYDPHGRYVELFWLGVLGPTATWLLRRLAIGLERCRCLHSVLDGGCPRMMQR